RRCHRSRRHCHRSRRQRLRRRLSRRSQAYRLVPGPWSLTPGPRSCLAPGPYLPAPGPGFSGHSRRLFAADLHQLQTLSLSFVQRLENLAHDFSITSNVQTPAVPRSALTTNLWALSAGTVPVSGSPAATPPPALSSVLPWPAAPVAQAAARRAYSGPDRWPLPSRVPVRW